MRKMMIIALVVLLCATSVFAQGSRESSAKPVQKVTLDVMMSFPRFTDQMEAYLDQFKAKMLQEKGIEVTINLEMPSSDQYNNILQTRLSSNDAPDLFTLHASADLPTYHKAEYVADLSQQPFAAKLYPDVRETVSIDGNVYAVPFESTVWGYLYNKDIFEAAGLSAPDTLQEMEHVVSVLKSKGYTPFQLAFQEQWVPQLMTALALGGKVSGQIPDWVDRMYEDKGSYSEVADIFGIIDLIMANGTPRAMETGSQQGAADFANGKAAMYVQGTWSAESILSVNPNIRIGVGALPVNNDISATRVNLATTTSLAVYANTPEMEMALALANYILDEKDSSALYEALKFNPVADVHEFEQFSWAKEASAYVAAGRAYQDLVLPNAVTDEQGKLLQSYYVRQVTKDDFIDIMDKTFKAANRARAQAE
jgi:raffinose/stachyose/melibiose transport system substrate-binding protein